MCSGLGVLFGKLQQGVVENRQLLTIARMRAEAEDVYGQRLFEIAPAVDKIPNGFNRDDGASVRKVRITCRQTPGFIIAEMVLTNMFPPGL